jgi:hypothetical protein
LSSTQNEHLIVGLGCWTAVLFLAFGAAPANAQTEDELRQQLDAQRAINEQLRKRIEALERQLEGAPAPALQAPERRAEPLELETADATTAIREALVAKGLVLLPRGSYRLSPGIAWAHSGADALHTRSDSYTAALTMQAGLPFGMQLTANAPYTHRDTSIGSNSGRGDFFVSLSKSLMEESDDAPSVVASLGYRHNNGQDAFSPVPIGFGFRVLTAELSGFKRAEPLVFYGSFGYSHPYSRTVTADNVLGESRFSGEIAPGDRWSYRLGTSLVATPDITLDVSVSGAFIKGTDVRSDARGGFATPKSTLGFFNLGAGFLLTKHLSLIMNGSAGITKDSADLILSVSFPYRFE